MTSVEGSFTEFPAAPRSWGSRGVTVQRIALLFLIVLAVGPRLAFLAWEQPYTPHHPDEHILSVEALALWEGVTPREVGWPASTTRLLFSGLHGARFLAGHGRELLAGTFESRMVSVSRWIGQQIVDPGSLYAVGRFACLATALAQIALTWWALRQWLPFEGAWFGTLAAALSPVVVSYSQFVLADVTGLLWATAVVGLAARRSRPAWLAGAGAASLAAASKFHFGIWLLAVVAALLTRADLAWRTRVLRTSQVVLVFGVILVLLVPWFWTSPLLALKEFAGVVLVKIGGGHTGEPLWSRAWHLLGGLGAFGLAGAALGIVPFWRRYGWQAVVVLLPAGLAVAALLPADIVFDRYALVIAPAIFLLAGAGWARMAEAGRFRWVVIGAAAITLILTGSDLVRSWQWQREPSVDQLAATWLRTHVVPGARIGLHSEANAYVPRTTRELETCASRPFSADAYTAKWATNGVRAMFSREQPFRNAVLNDENFQAFVCARELLVETREPGFEIVRFHDAARFDSVTTREAETLFDAARTGAPEALAVLVTNRPAQGRVEPTFVIRTRLGSRFIYAVPGALRALAK